jgi:hypothetical protein
MRSSSVAMITRVMRVACRVLSHTRWIMGFPARDTRGLPGKRVAE